MILAANLSLLSPLKTSLCQDGMPIIEQLGNSLTAAWYPDDSGRLPPTTGSISGLESRSQKRLGFPKLFLKGREACNPAAQLSQTPHSLNPFPCGVFISEHNSQNRATSLTNQIIRAKCCNPSAIPPDGGKLPPRVTQALPNLIKNRTLQELTLSRAMRLFKSRSDDQWEQHARMLSTPRIYSNPPAATTRS